MAVGPPAEQKYDKYSVCNNIWSVVVNYSCSHKNKMNKIDVSILKKKKRVDPQSRRDQVLQSSINQYQYSI